MERFSQFVRLLLKNYAKEPGAACFSGQGEGVCRQHQWHKKVSDLGDVFQLQLLEFYCYS